MQENAPLAQTSDAGVKLGQDFEPTGGRLYHDALERYRTGIARTVLLTLP
ncbi:hypothetical protein GTA44_21145 [Roseobacter sp. HKCCD9056]|nr:MULTISPECIES: hypothetical protein [unclassified Roseobacter]NNX92177.1 hypothetical protein [Roseobacter sp. HKCCD9056]NOB62615.1 hypothetical protein [Roseobacter sp. HKCCD8264]NPU52808.1 hypothetical protein [Roseobacter sp. HKCCD6565]